LVAAVAAIAGSVALSLLILHPPSGGLLPWSAPADRGHVDSVVLPPRRVLRTPVNTQLERPQPRTAAIVPPHRISRPFVPHVHRTRTPPEPAPPTPVTPPVTTPVVTPPTVTPTATTTTTGNGRWSAPKAETKTWNGAATKQSTRTQKGKPPWAEAKQSGPKQSPNQSPPTATTPTAAPTQPAPAPAPAPPAATTPPGQAKKTTPPPGQIKKTK
jgi:hypothetical protein